MSLLEQNTTKKGQVNELLELEPKFNIEEDKTYKVEVIVGNSVYIKVAKSHLLRLYYLVF